MLPASGPPNARAQAGQGPGRGQAPPRARTAREARSRGCRSRGAWQGRSGTRRGARRGGSTAHAATCTRCVACGSRQLCAGGGVGAKHWLWLVPGQAHARHTPSTAYAITLAPLPHPNPPHRACTQLGAAQQQVEAARVAAARADAELRDYKARCAASAAVCCGMAASPGALPSTARAWRSGRGKGSRSPRAADLAPPPCC